MKINFQHPALVNYNPLNGDYNENINEDGEIYVDASYQVCPTCEGKGRHFRCDLDENDLIYGMEEDGDYEGIESYYAGQFDQTCTHCSGERVIEVPNLPKWAEKLVYDFQRWLNQEAAISAAERRVGA